MDKVLRYTIKAAILVGIFCVYLFLVSLIYRGVGFVGKLLHFHGAEYQSSVTLVSIVLGYVIVLYFVLRYDPSN